MQMIGFAPCHRAPLPTRRSRHPSNLPKAKRIGRGGSHLAPRETKIEDAMAPQEEEEEEEEDEVEFPSFFRWTRKTEVY